LDYLLLPEPLSDLDLLLLPPDLGLLPVLPPDLGLLLVLPPD
jgi:hypothetical protein